jgi:deoxycytidine triphosphate deaminase
MIYCDHQIEKAIRDRRLIIDPAPEPSQFDSTSLNLRVGDDFVIWKPALQA